MIKLSIEIVVGIVGFGQLTSYEVALTPDSGQVTRQRWRVSTLEEWGEFLLNGNRVSRPVEITKFEVFKEAVDENIRSRLLEGRLT